MRLFDALPFDPFLLFQDGLAATEVDVDHGKVLQALVVPVMVVVADEPADLSFQIAG